MRTVTFRSSGRIVPVGKILCLGRNYAEHAREMQVEAPETPVVFIKPATALLGDGGEITIPPVSRDLHYEVEMVALIGKEGKEIPVSEAMTYIGGYGVGLDMTLRDVQTEAKKKGLPWSVAKGFDTSAPVSAFVEKEAVADPHCLDISLKVNGITRQHSNTRNMIFRMDFIIAFLSGIFTLEPGDLIFTGTPEGVGPAVAGNVLEAGLESVGKLIVRVR